VRRELRLTATTANPRELAEGPHISLYEGLPKGGALLVRSAVPTRGLGQRGNPHYLPMTTVHHQPVLLEPTLSYLALTPGDTVIDGTLGDGGHTQAILSSIGPTGRVLGIDASPASLVRARIRLASFTANSTLVNGNFRDMETIAHDQGITTVNAILLDLGLASWQLDESALGISFQRSEPLDMRLDPSLGRTAADILDAANVIELTEILETFGDIPRARNLATRILAAHDRKSIRTTDALVEAVGTPSPKVLAPIFQALRIAVNDELAALTDVVAQSLRLLSPHGRIVVLSYHSGEDRIVKRAFRDAEAAGLGEILTTKPVVAEPEEVRSNPRSRSAKLRAFERS